MKQASFFESLQDGRVKCFLCSHFCLISPGKTGLCGVRANRGGTLYSLNYGKLAALNIDPIEKKPLYHFFPGSSSLSIASKGCNFRCKHCQNYSISQVDKDSDWPSSIYPPEKVVEEALNRGCKSISYTYTEPTVYFEYVMDIARKAKAKGIKNVFVSNGYTSEKATAEITPFLDANNIDLKGNDNFYKSVCGARLQPVLDTIKRMKESGVWVEITTLLIPSLNDDDEFICWAAEFIKSVDASIPWHITAFHPTYKLIDKQPTPVSALNRARDIGIRSGLKYVYTGNVIVDGGAHTYCPACHKLLIERFGFRLGNIHIKEGKCLYCGFKIDGLGLP